MRSQSWRSLLHVDLHEVDAASIAKHVVESDDVDLDRLTGLGARVQAMVASIAVSGPVHPRQRH